MASLLLLGCGDDGSGTASADGSSSGTTGVAASTGDVSTSTGPGPPLVPCGDQCVDTDLDPLHCGGCDIACDGEQLCLAGDCVDLLCPPGGVLDCYSGLPDTAGVGACKTGTAQCNDAGTELGPCTGEVVPVDESCEIVGDEDCDGKTDEGCFLKNCREIKLAQPAAKDGNYKIDLDGDDGPLPPFMVQCDMTLDGGGWTRFNWLYKDYVADEDPLGQQLQDCKIDDLQCHGRIPAGPVTDLMVKDLTDKNHAMWKFNNTLISQAVLAALQSKKEYCGANQGAFAPYFSNSIEGYCGSGEEGGCDSFFYTSGACLNVGTWGMHFDGDNHWCAAAFKMGATVGGCGNTGDQGFLNDCDCDDEKGEMYYR